MEIQYFDELASTQIYLKEEISKKNLTAPIAVSVLKQTAGIGSRDNSWIGIDGNLFFSFAINKYQLPKDLLLQSASIYFSFLFKEILSFLGSEVFLKWPNDFYLNDKKIGGTVTNLVGDVLICGIGLNLKSPSKDFGELDIEIDKKTVLENYFKLIENKPKWQDIFSKFSVEFYKNQELITHHNGDKISLKSAILNEDGSLSVDGERVLSLR